MSTDEGLSQELTSLDVQREACAAYVQSQRHEGWILSADKYDDPACSGGNMNRAALTRLLNDVRAGVINIIVVYKIDRLTRNLGDFAKIVETLDAASASFVSITQTFNTSSSMGRLTLNILLSFAQFERELGSERVRDKIAASKARGMWTGGSVPLGYDLVDHKLVVSPIEAALVRNIMRKYLECRTVPALLARLQCEGVRTKTHVSTDGRIRGGIPYRSGAIRHLLRNITYLGRTKHGEKSYPGQHEAIVGAKLWNSVQELTARNAVRRRCGMNARNPSLLAGLVRDQYGRRMTPSHTVKGERRYLYYASNNSTGPPSQARSGRSPKIWRIPAANLESAVRQALAQVIADPKNLIQIVREPSFTAERTEAFALSAGKLSCAIAEMPCAELRRLLCDLSTQLTLHDDYLELSWSLQPIRQRLANGDDAGETAAVACDRLVTRVPALLTKRGHGLRLLLIAGDGRPNTSLVNLVVEAEAARAEAFEGAAATASARRDKRRMMRLAQLSYLAPDIVTAILNGNQPNQLTSRSLRQITRLPISWAEQRRLLGFTAIGT